MDREDEQVVRVLADADHRAVLATLSDAAGTLTVEALARRLARNASYSAAGGADVESVMLSLHHNHLPRLDEAGLIRYDRFGRTARYTGDVALENRWDGIETIEELLSEFDDELTDGDSIETLESSAEIYERGRRVADEAERELFLIYTSDELLVEGCVPHAKAAIERGVEFHAGAKSPSTRKFFRDYLPDATIWDPQLDWMNEGTSRPGISRLIFADREAVLVGLWHGSQSGTKTEVAMFGTGATNPLVVLIRELLGPRLDHLDYQSEAFLGDLPFEP